MANLTGLLWFNGMSPDNMIQNFSLAADAVPEAGMEVIEESVDRAEKRMKEIINSGGINKTQKGGPRRISDKMIDSVVGDTKLNGRNRIQGKMGFSEDTPDYTKWQEHGTARGIPEMLAYVTAQEELVADLSGKYASGDWLAAVFKRYM